MIDHVSIGVQNLKEASRFYEMLLSEIGFNRLIDKEGTVGFGKKYAEFWLNERPNMSGEPEDRGLHICFRTRSKELVDGFHRKALELGATDSGAPGLREIYSENYYAAFVRDPDGNVVEVVTFLT